MAKNGSLSANQEKAIAALLVTTSVSKAAKMAGLGERTIYRYLADDNFRNELRRRQEQILAAAIASLTGLIEEAVATLKQVFADPKASQSTKVRAALGVLQELRRIKEFEELEERITKLEERCKWKA